jgi:hypothetical protein
MSLNFGQFPTPRLPIASGDFVVGYQLVGGVPTLAQYTINQILGGVFPGGVVQVTQGGTGLTAVTTGSVLVGGTAGVLNTAPPGTAGTVLVSQGPGQVPLFSNLIVTNGTTQGRLDNSTLVATDAFVNQQIASSTATVTAAGVTGGIYNQASLGSGAQIVIFATGGVVNGVLTISNPGSGYAVGDLLILPAGNSDAIVRVTGVSGTGVSSVSVVYGGSGYTTGPAVTAIDVPPGQRTVTFTGVLTSNLTFIIQRGTFLTASRRVQFNNNTTGAFTVTVFLSNGAGGTTGSGVVLPQGTNNSGAVIVETDGVNDVWLSNTPLGIGAVPSASPVIAGGTINNTTVGATTPSTGAFTTLNASGNDALLYSNVSGQSIPNATATTVTNWTKTFDRVNTNFNAVTGVFTAPATGEYFVSGQLLYAANTGAISSSVQTLVVANGVTVATGINIRDTATSAGEAANVACVVSLTSGQTVVLQAFQSSGGAVLLQAGAGGFNYLSINRVP